MADEARLIVELKDNSGNPGGSPSTSPSQGSGPNPGPTASQDVHNQASAAGAGARAGAGSSSPTPASVPSPAPASLPPAIPAPGGDPLLNAVRALLAADPNVTPAELQMALGIDANRANVLLQAAQGNAAGAAAPAVSPNTATPPPTTAPPGAPVPPPVPPPIQPPPAPPPVQQIPSPGMPGWQQFAQGAGGLGAIGGQLGGPVGGAAGNLVQTALAAGSMGPAMFAGAVTAGVTALVTAEIAGAFALAEGARNRIREISPEVAAAEARAEVRQLAADMRTSRRLSDEVATYVDRRSRLSTTFQETKDIIGEPVIDILSENLSALDRTLKGVNAILGTGAAEAAIGGGLRLNVFGTVASLNELFTKFFGEEEAKAGSPYTWLEGQPFLDPPPPFSADVPANREQVDRSTFAPIPGLKL